LLRPPLVYGTTLIDATLITADDNEYSHRSDIVVDDEDMVHVFCSDKRGANTQEIFYTKLDPSLDDQDGDPADESVITVIDDTMLTTDDDETSSVPQAAFQCGYIHVTWKDSRIYQGSDPPEDVFYMVLDTDGNVVVPETALTTGSTLDYTHDYADNVIPVAVDSNGKAHAAWCDDRSGDAEIWYTTYQGPVCVVPEEVPPPIANFSATPTMGEAPLHVQFRDQSTGDIDDRLWSFGGGSSSTGINPSHIFQDEGIYTVSLTVTGPGGEDTAYKEIMVESMAVAARLTVRNLNISAVHAQPRQAVMITANVVNEGGTWGSQTLNLLINGYLEQSVGVGVAPGTSQPINFTVYKVQAGEYQVTIGDAIGTFFVIEEAAPPTPKPGGLLVGGELDQGSIIAIVVIGIILVGGIVVAVLFSRQR
jgi:PKD repeat protein